MQKEAVSSSLTWLASGTCIDTTYAGHTTFKKQLYGQKQVKLWYDIMGKSTSKAVETKLYLKI